MSFVINFPRRSRPRGLGYAGGLGHTLTGLGTWVVDAEYGLGPRFREGFNRPYPEAAYPTRYPRAQAARVLGPSASANVVARPFAATRLPTTRYPVRAAPITAPGARLRNPGVAGVDGVTDWVVGFSPVGLALTERSVWGPAAAGAGLRAATEVTGVTGRPKKVLGWVALLLLGTAAVNWYRQYDSIAREFAPDVAAPGPAAVKGAMANSKDVIADPGATDDAAKRGVLLQYAAYENARRTDTWLGRLRGTARDPLKTTGMTAAQAAVLRGAFAKISRADRRRLAGAIYGPGGSLEDLG